MELCTPTGAAILTTVATSWGPQPADDHHRDRDRRRRPQPEGHANVLRILVAARATPRADSTPLLLETNVDDLDPRVWPSVIAALLDAGASDAWLTPILMKKGRPAHTLSVLVAADRADGVRETVFRHTSTIGLREQVARQARPRAHHGRGRGRRPADRGQARAPRRRTSSTRSPSTTTSPARPTALGRPVSDVLAAAIAATHTLLEERG